MAAEVQVTDTDQNDNELNNTSGDGNLRHRLSDDAGVTWLEILNLSGVIKFRVDSNGRIRPGPLATDGVDILLNDAASTSDFAVRNSTLARVFQVNSDGTVVLDDSGRLNLNSAYIYDDDNGDVVVRADDALGSSGLELQTNAGDKAIRLRSDGFIDGDAGANNIGFRLGNDLGTAEFQVQNASGTALFRVGSDGYTRYGGPIDLNGFVLRDASQDRTTVKLRDAAGVSYLGIIDSGNAEVATIDSDGNADFDGQVTSHTSINTQTGTAYTLVLADDGKIIEMNNASANEVNIPANASVAFPIGTRIDVVQLGAGTTSIDPEAGVTLNGGTATLAMTGTQYEAVTLYKRATDEWVVIGALA